MPQVFVEVNPYHAQTLFTYHAQLSSGPDDIVFGHERLLEQPFFSEIPAIRRRATVGQVLRAVGRRDVHRCHFNTINVVLTPLNRETLWLGAVVIVMSLGARLAGCRLTAVLHEPDQFFQTGLDSSRRATLFRTLLGRWWVRLFDQLFVVTPEVQASLRSRGVETQLLSASALQRFGKPAAQPVPGGRTVAWIGPVISLRRSWKALSELDANRLRSAGVTIDMLCDGRAGDAPALRAELEHAGLSQFFKFRDYRPDDYELVERVRQSVGVMCLYGSPEYGVTKSSGARIVAWGLEKPCIVNRPSLGICGPEGIMLETCKSLEDCVDALVQRFGGPTVT